MMDPDFSPPPPTTSLAVISAVIPTLNAEPTLEKTLLCLNGARLVAEIVVADGGSRDKTRALAENIGARVCFGEPGRGPQLANGARHATQDWLLFLHADTVLAPGWEAAAAAFMEDGSNRERAAVFRFRLDDAAFGARWLEALVALRVGLFALPYGDQGLLIAKSFYDSLGGFRDMPLMEDVDMIRRIGRERLTVLPVSAVTSAERYKRGGYLLRPLRNAFCLLLYFLGVSPRAIGKLYR